MTKIYADVANGWQCGFQEPVTSIQQGIISFHGDIMVLLVYVVGFVGYVLWRVVEVFREGQEVERNQNVHGVWVEVVWTCVPGLLLMCVGVPSFTLLYAVDEVVDPGVTVKIIGHQWYWSYEYGDEEKGVEFESYMVGEDDLQVGELRLLEVDNRMVVPEGEHIRMVVTAADVIHNVAIPAMGVKMDAVPGRLNEVSVMAKRQGVFYGQCSELCGVNHAFMPIVVEVVSGAEYVEWMKEQ